MSNGFDVHREQRGGDQANWPPISIGHQLRVHRQIVALWFCPIKKNFLKDKLISKNNVSPTEQIN